MCVCVSVALLQAAHKKRAREREVCARKKKMNNIKLDILHWFLMRTYNVHTQSNGISQCWQIAAFLKRAYTCRRLFFSRHNVEFKPAECADNKFLWQHFYFPKQNPFLSSLWIFTRRKNQTKYLLSHNVQKRIYT